MKEHITVLTRKGQITVPAGMRRALGLKQGDKIAVRMDGSDIWLALARSAVERTAGAVHTNQPPLPAKELREVSEEARAQEAMERGVGKS